MNMKNKMGRFRVIITWWCTVGAVCLLASSLVMAQGAQAQNAAHTPREPKLRPEGPGKFEDATKQPGKVESVEELKERVDEIERATYRYDGSLTTPPCSEGVKWVVFTTPIRLSAKQVGMFREILKGNNRPAQPLNNRAVVTERAAEKVAGQ